MSSLVEHATPQVSKPQLAQDLILVSRNLERIADYATNVAEGVTQMLLGSDIYHLAEERVPK